MTDKRDFTIDLWMTGSGEKVITVDGYKYVAVLNGTPNDIELYVGAVTSATKSSARRVVRVPLYTMITVPLFQDTQYTAIYTDGGGSDPKTAQLIFSDKNLNINGMIGSPSAGGNVIISGDSVGLAKDDQLPAALSTLGNLKVAIEESGAVLSVDDNGGSLTTDTPQLPDTLGAGGGLKVERIDAGRQTGVATAAGDTTIKASAGKVWAIVCVTTGVTAKLKDDITDKWAVTDALPGNFAVPIACGTSIVLNLSGAGEAYVLYE